jgi:hypothetical protein
VVIAGLYQVVVVLFSQMVDKLRYGLYSDPMNNLISKKNSSRSAQITRMLDKAEEMITDARQTLDDEAWMLESLMNGLNYQRWNKNDH